MVYFRYHKYFTFGDWPSLCLFHNTVVNASRPYLLLSSSYLLLSSTYIPGTRHVLLIVEREIRRGGLMLAAGRACAFEAKKTKSEKKKNTKHKTQTRNLAALGNTSPTSQATWRLPPTRDGLPRNKPHATDTCTSRSLPGLLETAG